MPHFKWVAWPLNVSLSGVLQQLISVCVCIGSCTNDCSKCVFLCNQLLVPFSVFFFCIVFNRFILLCVFVQLEKLEFLLYYIILYFLCKIKSNSKLFRVSCLDPYIQFYSCYVLFLYIKRIYLLIYNFLQQLFLFSVKVTS